MLTMHVTHETTVPVEQRCLLHGAQAAWFLLLHPAGLLATEVFDSAGYPTWDACNYVFVTDAGQHGLTSLRQQKLKIEVGRN